METALNILTVVMASTAAVAHPFGSLIKWLGL